MSAGITFLSYIYRTSLSFSVSLFSRNRNLPSLSHFIARGNHANKNVV